MLSETGGITTWQASENVGIAICSLSRWVTHPTDGIVKIGGFDILEQPEQAKRLIGYLPEQPPLYPNETPQEYLTFVGEAKGLRGKELRREIDSAVESAGIEQVRDRLIGTLSKGYRQRVGIAQALLGVLPGSATVTGTVMLDGKDLLHTAEKEMNQIRGSCMAYIPQGSGNGLNPLYTIGHQMCETIRKHEKCSRKEALQKSANLLETFGLEDGPKICRSFPFQLSGGMRQRVLVAMGIAAGADLVLADEPTKGLDQNRINLVEEAFHLLGGRTLLCVTHDLRFAKAIASRVVVMYASQQIESGSRDDFFEKPLHPYSQAMLNALPENGLKSNMGFAPPRTDLDAQNCCHFYGRCPDACERCIQAPPLVDVGERKVRCWKYVD